MNMVKSYEVKDEVKHINAWFIFTLPFIRNRELSSRIFQADRWPVYRS